MRPVIQSFAILLAATGVAAADRPVNDAEKAKLVSALTDQGCHGGELSRDDDEYEVDNAVCADGHVYDLKFGLDFKLLHQEREK